MNDYLQQYEVVLRTIGPVFVGSGREFQKNEYIFLGSRKVQIPDMQKLYYLMQKKGKAAAFEEYMLSGKTDLNKWLRLQGMNPGELSSAIRYELDCGDAILKRGKQLTMKECIKNPYGEPYIPGTTLKGMFRTLFLCEDIINNRENLCEDIINNREKYKRETKYLADEIRKPENRINRSSYLQSNARNIEAVKYRTLNRKEDAPKDAVNDWMQGFVVSDSDPLSTEDLVLCQKVDRKPDGTENRHAILRESIKPGTAIRFTITVDTSVCHLDKQILANALRTVITDYHRNFRMAFAGMPALKTNYLYLGGGSGFVSKTIVYSAYGKNMGIDLTQRIFDKIKVPREHRHSKDKEYGVSPHTLKCTYYQRERLEMGLCKVEKFRLLNP